MDENRKNMECIYICGCTGTGKSAAAVKLATKFNGEVINADALQLYKGLDIATAKITTAEMSGVPHHLLNILEYNDKSNVRIFREKAIEVIDDLNARSVLPIVVGGTHYYIEGLLFQNSEKEILEHQEINGIQESRLPIEPYAQLQQLDPPLASTIHPNDARRIERALASLARNFRTQNLRLPLRYPNSIVVVIECEMELLKARLRARVDQMVQNGLVKEVLDFHRQYPLSSNSVDLSDISGVNIAIGYKELMPYVLEVEKCSPQISTDDPNAQCPGRNLQDLLDLCIERIKVSTIQYARRQRTWINNSLTQKCSRAGIPVIILDLFNPPGEDTFCSSSLLTKVYSMEDFFTTISRIRGQSSQGFEERSIVDPSLDKEHVWKKRKIFTCDTCPDQSFQGHDQYQIHLKSKKHKRSLSSLRKREHHELQRKKVKDDIVVAQNIEEQDQKSNNKNPL